MPEENIIVMTFPNVDSSGAKFIHLARHTTAETKVPMKKKTADEKISAE